MQLGTKSTPRHYLLLSAAVHITVQHNAILDRIYLIKNVKIKCLDKFTALNDANLRSTCQGNNKNGSL